VTTRGYQRFLNCRTLNTHFVGRNPEYSDVRSQIEKVEIDDSNEI
jgi:hypothetical protein